MKEEKLIPSKKIYYVLSGVGLCLSIISISLLFSLDKLWLNVSLSILCIIYAVIFVIVYLKIETKEKCTILGLMGWMLLIFVIAFLSTAIFIGIMDETNSFPVLKVLFIAIDLTPGIYILIKLIVFLVTLAGWAG